MSLTNLLTAIFAKTAGSTLTTYVGGRIYLDQAPEGVDYPHVVLRIVGEIPEYPGGKTMEDIYAQFSIYSIAQNGVEVNTALGYLRTLFDDCTLTITGETLVYFIRDNLMTMFDDVTTKPGTTGIRHYAQSYQVCTTK